jgi:hypothetical protein
MPADVSFDSEDYALPRWKIDKATGEFVSTVTGESKPHIMAVIIKADKSRFMWPQKFNKDNLPDCYSTNGVFPVDSGTKYGTFNDRGVKVCNNCPMAEWVNGDKPRCAVSFNYLLLDLDTDQLSVLNLSRSRAKTAKALNSLWRLNGVQFALTFYTEIEKNPSGDFWQVKFQMAQRVERWQPYAIKMIESRNIELTGSIETVKDELTELEEITKPEVDPQTGEVIDKFDF